MSVSDIKFEITKGVLRLSHRGDTVDRREFAAWMLRGLNIDTSTSQIMEVKLRMSSIGGPGVGALIQFETINKGEPDNVISSSTRIPYTEKWRTIRINLGLLTNYAIVDRLRVHVTDLFSNSDFQGWTHVDIEYIKFIRAPQWFKLPVFQVYPPLNIPLYRMEITDRVQFLDSILVPIGDRKLWYSDDYSGIKWISESNKTEHIHRIPGANCLAPKVYYRKGTIVYKFHSKEPIQSMIIKPRIAISSTSPNNYIKVYVSRNGTHYELLYKITGNTLTERPTSIVDPLIHATSTIKGFSKAYLKIEMYTDAKLKYEQLVMDTQLKALRVYGSTSK